jgi:hypothetical protein
MFSNHFFRNKLYYKFVTITTAKKRWLLLKKKLFQELELTAEVLSLHQSYLLLLQMIPGVSALR